jgi:hypothetical protein
LTPADGVRCRYGGEELFLIQGKIKQLQTALTREDLMREIDLRAKDPSSDRQDMVAANAMHDLLSSASTTMFTEGEDLHNFAGLVGGKLVCGVFPEANRLESNDKILAVVSERSGVLYAHSVQRASDHLLLLPPDTFAGQDALFQRCMRFAWRMTIFLWILFGIGQIVYNTMYPESGQSYLFDFFVTLLAPPLLMFTTEYFTYRKLDGAGEYARAIFEVYRIPEPDSFDAVSGMDFFKQNSATFFAMNADKALKKHLKKFNIAQ